MSQKYTINVLKSLAIIPIVLLFTACSSKYPNKPFSLMNEHRPVKSTSVAVIAGADDEGTLQLVDMITNRLSERSSFRVLTQEEIGKIYPKYPFSIELRNDVHLEDEQGVWFINSEKSRLNNLQKKLKVDYLYIVWVPLIRALSIDTKTTYYVYPWGNMIEYPSGNVVASTRFKRGESDSILALFRPKGYYVVKALESSSKDIVDEMIKVSKADKAK